MEVEVITQKAEQLHELRREIARIEEINQQELEPLKKQRDELQASLIQDMTTGGVKSLKVSTGETFTKAVRQSIAIVNEFFALEWAKKHDAIAVNTKLVAQMAKNGMELPEHIFRPVETEYISVRKPQES